MRARSPANSERNSCAVVIFGARGIGVSGMPALSGSTREGVGTRSG